MAINQHERPEDHLSWARTGRMSSTVNHLAKIEPFQNQALCGVNIAGMTEIRPLNYHGNTCGRCVREARKLGVEGLDRIGIENDLTSELTTGEQT